MRKDVLISIMLANLAVNTPKSGIYADELTSINIEPQTESSAELQLITVGEGQLSVLFWDVYKARLLTHTGQYVEGQPLALEFTYLRDFTKDQLIEETLSQWRELELEPLEQESQWALQLGQIWPDVKEQDRIMFYIDKEGRTRFYFNGNYSGSIRDIEFAKRFAAIWLDEKTSAPDVRKQLLGKN